MHVRGPELICYDPNVFMDIFRKEGRYPNGPAEEVWPFIRYMKERNYPAVLALTKHGEKWWDMRQKLNPDMFNLVAVAAYLPLINEAARTASEHIGDATSVAPLCEFMNYAALDMFSAFALGRQLKT